MDSTRNRAIAAALKSGNNRNGNGLHKGHKPVVLITGAAGLGLGDAMVGTFWAEGWSIVGVDKKPLSHLINGELSSPSRGQFFKFIQADLMTDEGCTQVLDETLAVGVPDAIVNSAHFSPGAANDLDVLSTTAENYQRSLLGNAMPSFRICHAFLPHWIERRRGRLIQISSVNAFNAGFGNVGYASGKLAMQLQGENIAAAHCGDGITVAILQFDWLASAPTKTNAVRHARYPDALRAIAQLRPDKRIMTHAQAAQKVYEAAVEEDPEPITTKTFDGGRSRLGNWNAGDYRQQAQEIGAALSPERDLIKIGASTQVAGSAEFVRKL